MAAPFKLAIIGLDTSHSVELPRLMQGDAPEETKIGGLQAVTAMRFPSPFQAEEGQDGRQKQLEQWGITVGTDFDAAVKGVDGIMLEINDPALHLQYVEKAIKTGLPLFIDKPLADTVANGRKILDLIEKHRIPSWSASSLRFYPDIAAAHAKMPRPDRATVHGAMGTAPAGSSLIWYGVHVNEMANILMGRGAKAVYAHKDEAGITQVIQYGGPRRAIIECLNNVWTYGGYIQTGGESHAFVNMKGGYHFLMQQVRSFFLDGTIPVPLESSLEILAVMEAAERSLASRSEESVQF